MKINSIKINGYKNLRNVEIEPFEKTNIIFGDNAQGKTNLIEAIWISSGVKSFRGTRDRDFVDINGERAEIEVTFENSFRTQTIKIACARPNVREKSVTLNGVKLGSVSKLFGNLNCVVFTPEDLELSKGSPDNRRSFVDLSVSQIKNSYSSVISKYDNILQQRNTLLKNINYGSSKKDELEVWDIQLARLGAYISMLRYNYVKKLNSFTKKLYNQISSGREELELFYNSSVFKDLEGEEDFNGKMAEEYLDLLKSTLYEDLKFGFTQKGVHRDDVISTLDKLNTREFGSQGQNRSVALVMKLAQAYILFEETDEEPVILLDDVLSELDAGRQEFVKSKIENFQIFITCCEKPNHKTDNQKLFEVKSGHIL
ncbi:MAG: DNA replication/repair protein RecF [Clostridiales bacterium]|nr:DNA replication/repair protein RecF [Clostridiales bacterium]